MLSAFSIFYSLLSAFSISLLHVSMLHVSICSSTVDFGLSGHDERAALVDLGAALSRLAHLFFVLLPSCL